MKIKHRSFFIVLLALQFSCGQEQDYFPSKTAIDNSSVAYLKFVHAASDTVGVNYFLGDLKVTAGTPSTLTGTTNTNIGTVPYLNAFPITDYTTVTPGALASKVIVPEFYTTTKTYGTKTLNTGNVSLVAGSSYTVAFVGVTPAYETVLLSDDLSTAPIDGKAYIKFANFIHNSPGLSLRATPPVNKDGTVNAPVILFSNIAYKSASGFTALPLTGTYTSVQIIDESIIPPKVIATLASNVSTFSDNKVYTIFARGQIGVTGAKAPGGNRIINR